MLERIDYLKSNGINLYQAKLKLAEQTTSIRIEDLEVLTEFIKDNKIKFVFYELKYENRENYIINEYHMDELSEEIVSAIIPYVDEYNDELNQKDFGEPSKITIFFVYENVFYMYSETSFDLMFLTESSKALNAIVKEHKDDIRKAVKDYQDSVEQLKAELHDKILNDEEFQRCTNKRLRGTYANNLRHSLWFAKYRKAFTNIEGDYRHYEVYDFIELCWREFKEQNKKN